MQKEAVIAGVSTQIVWWMGERKKKLVELRHETMSVNPFLLPFISSGPSMNWWISSWQHTYLPATQPGLES